MAWVKEKETCPVCHGEGTIEDSEYIDGEYRGTVDVQCYRCNGTGEVEKQTWIDRSLGGGRI